MILYIAYYSKVKDSSKLIDYFESKHKSVRDDWRKNNDFVYPSFFIDKMDYSKNCAPFSIYPFDIETCTDIMMGKLMIKVLFNFSEVLRIIKKSGWNIDDALNFKSENEINAFRGKDIKDVSFLKISKGHLTIDVQPSSFARINYELSAPSTLIEEFEDNYKKGPQEDFDNYLINYLDEQKIWN